MMRDILELKDVQRQNTGTANTVTNHIIAYISSESKSKAPCHKQFCAEEVPRDEKKTCTCLVTALKCTSSCHTNTCRVRDEGLSNDCVQIQEPPSQHIPQSLA